MMNYRFWNNTLGWVAFLVAFITYYVTMEPTTSFWDCGEFIASSYKLQVGHPPGAPLFLMMGRFFALFANGDPTMVAYWINMVSVLSSALTIAFLFWTITILARKIINKDTPNLNPDDLSLGSKIAVLGSGLIGALAYTFSDTFWFSAVEAEVYATSSLFTALVFWAMLRWDESADKPHADRWLVLIAYLMGLSIGVHLLNLLTIPALAFIYYFRRYKPNVLGVLGTLFLGVFLLVFVQYGIIPGFVESAGQFELFFTNTLSLPFLSGLIFYSILILAFITLGLWLTSNKKAPIALYLVATAVFWFILTASIVWVIIGLVIFGVSWLVSKNAFLSFIVAVTGIVPGVLLWFGVYSDKSNDKFADKEWHSASSTMNLLISFFAVILMGYTSYALIIIRSNANTPMDENNPADVFSLLSYLNREQYGSQPLAYGPYYYAQPTEYKDNGPIITRAYTILDSKGKQVNYFTEKFEAESFVKLSKEKDNKDYTIGYKYLETDRKKEPGYSSKESTLFPRMWSSQSHHIKEYKYWGQVKGSAKPTFINNMVFFFKYHIGHMYNRYFLWNFVGRQNDIQGNGEPTQGNWISGIGFLDEMFTGAPQSKMPESAASNHGRNAYFFLPLLLGLGGLVYHLMRNSRNFIIVFMLFFLTGYAIVLYLNQTPLQPRERDYAYAGSFYAFAIWIGLGVLAIYDVLENTLKTAPKVALAGLATLVSVSVPTLMAFQNYDDHNRAGRYTARDFAFNYLNTCEPNAIIFTNGDNDTFPLWYAQEVEGVRTDVRVVNLSLLNTDWYIDQMKRAAYDGPGVPFGMRQDQYLGTKRDQVLFDSENAKYYTIKEHFNWLLDGDKNQVDVGSGQKLFYFKSNKFIIPVDSAKVVSNGTVPKGMESRVAKDIRLEIKRSYVLKSDLMILSLLNNFNWDRPIYFAITVGEDFMGLQEYFQLEGMAYRLVPYKARSHDRQPGEVNSEVMYKNLMTKFVWGNMEDPNVYLDETNLRMTFNFRNSFVRLASKLYMEGKKKKAIEVLDKAEVLMPDSRIPYNYFNLLMTDIYIDLQQYEKAENMLNRLEERTQQDVTYFAQFSASSKPAINDDARRAEMILQSVQELRNKLRVVKQNPTAIDGASDVLLDSGDSIIAPPAKDSVNP
jgi:hypothetical protein